MYPSTIAPIDHHDQQTNIVAANVNIAGHTAVIHTTNTQGTSTTKMYLLETGPTCTTMSYFLNILIVRLSAVRALVAKRSYSAFPEFILQLNYTDIMAVCSSKSSEPLAADLRDGSLAGVQLNRRNRWTTNSKSIDYRR